RRSINQAKTHGFKLYRPLEQGHLRMTPARLYRSVGLDPDHRTTFLSLSPNRCRRRHGRWISHQESASRIRPALSLSRESTPLSTSSRVKVSGGVSSITFSSGPTDTTSNPSCHDLRRTFAVSSLAGVFVRRL